VKNFYADMAVNDDHMQIFAVVSLSEQFLPAGFVSVEAS